MLRNRRGGRKKLYGKVPTVRSLVHTLLTTNHWKAKKFNHADPGATYTELIEYCYGQRALVEGKKASKPSRSMVANVLREMREAGKVEHKVIAGNIHKFYYIDIEDRKK